MRRRGVDEVVALAVDRAEAKLLDAQQPVGQIDDGAPVAVVGVQDVDQRRGSAAPAAKNKVLTCAQEKKFGCTI